MVGFTTCRISSTHPSQPLRVARNVVLVPGSRTGSHSACSGRSLCVLISDDIGEVEERSKGSSEADELGREDVEVSYRLDL